MKLFSLMDTAFENYDSTVKSYLAKTMSSIGLQYTDTQIFGIIFDALKGIMQNAMFYIEDAMNEQNIFKATRKQSIFSLARLSGYEPYYGAAATGTIISRIAINNGISNSVSKIFIMNGTKIVDESTGYGYCIILPSDNYVIDITRPMISHEFSVVQGYFDTINYTARGYFWESIPVSTTELFDKQYIEVKVDGVKWDEYSTFYDMCEDDKGYVLTTGFDNSFDILFGNGTYGKKLEEGQNVNIKYLKHIGTSGNINPTRKPSFSFVNKLYDSMGNTVDGNNYIILTMHTTITGGTNSDTTNFVKSMIGMNSRSLVLASEDNFKLFFKRFSFIGKVNCWSEKNTMCVTACCLRDISNYIKSVDSYYNIDVNNLLLTNEHKSMIITTLENSKKTFAGITIKFQDPLIRRFAIICYVKPDTIYAKESIRAGIKYALAEYFMNKIEDTQFIAKSDLIQMLLNKIPNIKSIDIDIISELAEQTFKNGFYNKYELKMVNGVYKYIPRKILYETNSNPGIDLYGNISLDSKLEIPILQGSFDYYPNKEDYVNGKNDSIKLETVQIYFM